MNKWNKNPIRIIKNGIAYYSIAFTWQLKQVKYLIMQGDMNIKKTIVGGPAVNLMPKYLANIAEVSPDCSIDFLSMHNPDATFTTRGCPNKCSFCAVPKTEGDLVELPTWEPRPIVCDNNLLAASRKHFDRAIDSFKSLPWCDFNQGLDARLFSEYKASRIAELKKPLVRFACDSQFAKAAVSDAVNRGRKNGLKNFAVYVLIGHKDSPADALDRLTFIQSLGIWPNPMRYQPLDVLEKNSFVDNGWTNRLFYHFLQYWSRLRVYEHIPFEEFNRKQFYRRIDKKTRQERLKL